MQLEYSLVARDVESEHRARRAGRRDGRGAVEPAGGRVPGGQVPRDEDTRARAGSAGATRSRGLTKFTERNWAMLDALRAVAGEVGRPPAQVALAWVLARPGITASIVGASNPAQLEGHLAALDISLTPPHLEMLDKVSSPGLTFFSAGLRQAVFGGASVRGWND